MTFNKATSIAGKFYQSPNKVVKHLTILPQEPHNNLEKERNEFGYKVLRTHNWPSFQFGELSTTTHIDNRQETGN